MKIAKIIVKDVEFILKCDKELKKEVFRSLKRDGVKITVSKVRETLKNNFNSSQQLEQQLQEEKKRTIHQGKKEAILVVVHEAQPAGAALLSLNIIKNIIKFTSFQPVVLLLRGGELVSEFKKYATVYEMNLSSFQFIENEQLLNDVLDNLVDDGVRYAICNSVTCGLPLKQIKKHGMKAITMVHELPTSIMNYGFDNAARNTQEYSDIVVFPAEFVRDEFLRVFPMNIEKTRIIPQGVYAKFKINGYEEKQEYKKKVYAELGIEEDSKLVLGCGYGNMRKGVDFFVQAAQNICVLDEKYHFLWLGNIDVELGIWMKHDLEKLGLENQFHWKNFVSNPGDYFAASDVFFLSSKEDPFPSVALEAMENYSLVVAIENTGGIPEMLNDTRGLVLPYGDVSGMYDLLNNCFNDVNKRDDILKNAKVYANSLTMERYVKKIITEISDDSFIKEDLLSVSVIIPNYNYEKFLEERIQSIVNQTYEPCEIIFLDDCSTDGSISKATEILSQTGIDYQIIPNQTNNGCFKQWLKGISLAKGELVWIAEADDVCETDFLETVVAAFKDDEVNLSYAQSEVVDEFGNHSGYVYTEYTKDLDEEKWLSSYINNGQAEIIEGLGIKNTIPNASGVVMRKSALDGIEELLSQYAISGDWFTYVYLMRRGKIAFNNRVLNYHRRHSSSIIHKREQDIKLFEELMNIKLFVATEFLIPEDISNRFLNHVKSEFVRLLDSNSKKSFDDFETLAKKQSKLEKIVDGKINRYSFLKNGNKKRILFVAPDFEMGGGQMLVVRLANFFSDFHDTFIYNARPAQQEDRVVNMISSKVTILKSQGTPDDLKGYILEKDIQVINNHIWWADKLVFQACKDLDNVQIILSMHGCYEMLLDNPKCDTQFEELVPQIFQKAKHIIYATDKNKKIFGVVDTPEEKIHKIHYGYKLESIPPKKLNEIGEENAAFVFGQVARGIKEKGFEESIKAFIELQKEVNQQIALVLVGNGEFINSLKTKYNNPNIHFIDNLTKPSEWIGWVKQFDVGLLPTYFVSESLPNTVIEYLAYGVPVISTNIGDIKEMIIGNGSTAGHVLELDNGKVDINSLKASMKQLLLDEEEYNKCKEGTHVLFEQFEMCNFAEKYYKLFVE